MPTTGSTKAVHVSSCLCDDACKRSLAICRKSTWHCVPLAGFCLSLYSLDVLNGDVNMIQTNKQITSNVFSTAACEDRVVWLRSRAAGLNVNCPHVAGDNSGTMTLDQCKHFACQHGGNTFNYQPAGFSWERNCYVKNCSSSLQTQSGGFNMYVMLHLWNWLLYSTMELFMSQ